MKLRILFLFVGLASVLFGVSCRQHDYRTLTINVPEMRNDACGRVVQNAIARAPGLQHKLVKIDVPGRKVVLTYDSLLIADKNFEFMVAKAGFEANGIPADKKAAAALPPECLR